MKYILCLVFELFTRCEDFLDKLFVSQIKDKFAFLKPIYHTSPFFPRGLSTVSLDGLSERGTTLNLAWGSIFNTLVAVFSYMEGPLANSEKRANPGSSSPMLEPHSCVCLNHHGFYINTLTKLNFRAFLYYDMAIYIVIQFTKQ